MKHARKYHCISCSIFDEHMYDNVFMNHECQWYDEEDVPEEQLVCPECGMELDHDENYDEDYCPHCGLVVSGPYPYTAGRPIVYPYGLRI
jgi:DNA-directed RNA polymerase subunit RPC12/RpoP